MGTLSPNMKTFKLFFLLALVGLFFFAGPVGCSHTLQKGGVYQGDKVLYEADKAISAAYATAHAFVKWEYENRNTLPVEVSKAADVIRANAERWISSATSLRDIYARTRSVEDAKHLEAALDVLAGALEQAQLYMKPNAPPLPK